MSFSDVHQLDNEVADDPVYDKLSLHTEETYNMEEIQR